MNRVERRGAVKYEDLMQELEAFEQELLGENRSMGMDLMVLEAKIRERFQQMENRLWDRYTALALDNDEDKEEELSLADIEAMIPRDLIHLPSGTDFADGRRRKRAIQTIGLAAVLAVLTAACVFGLASLLQIAIGWMA